MCAAINTKVSDVSHNGDQQQVRPRRSPSYCCLRRRTTACHDQSMDRACSAWMKPPIKNWRTIASFLPQPCQICCALHTAGGVSQSPILSLHPSRSIAPRKKAPDRIAPAGPRDQCDLACSVHFGDELELMVNLLAGVSYVPLRQLGLFVWYLLVGDVVGGG